MFLLNGHNTALIVAVGSKHARNPSEIIRRHPRSSGGIRAHLRLPRPDRRACSVAVLTHDYIARKKSMMMPRCTAPPPTIALRAHSDAVCNWPGWLPEDIALAQALFTVWATRTGRTLRAVPVIDLTACELIEFWADDQIDYPPVATDP
jgi:hypothetical protein